MNDYFQSDKFKDNLKMYEDAVKSGESFYMESDDLTDIAEYYHSRGELNKAVSAVDYAIELFPGATAPLAFRARAALLVEKDFDKANEYAEQIDDKSDLDYFYIKAEIMIVNEESEKADKFLSKQFHNIDEDDKEDFVLDVATLFADYEIMDKAQKWIDMSDAKNDADYKEIQGRIALSMGNYEESESIFNQLLDENPYSSPYWNHLASSQFLRNDIQDSITSSEFSIAINPNDEEAILNKANGLFSLGNYEEALKYYRRFTQLCPNEETGEMFQSIVLINMNRIQEAVQHLENAEQIAGKDSPNIVEIYQQMAFTLSKLGKLDKALEYVDKTEDIETCNHNDMMVLRGHLLLEHGKSEEALVFFKKALHNSKFSAKTFLRIAISIYDCGYLNLAHKLFKTLFDEVDEDWTDGYSYMAHCCYDLGNMDEYEQYRQKAETVNPSEANAVLEDIDNGNVEIN